MWEHYRKTFLRMQLFIVAVVLGALVATRQASVAAGFFVVMELFSAYGAVWGQRIKRFSKTGRFIV